MPRRILVLLVLAAVVLAAMATWFSLSRVNFAMPAAPGTTRESAVSTVDRALEPFHAIAVHGSADITLVQGSTPAIRVESGDDARVVARVRDGELSIGSHDARRGGLRGLVERAPRSTPRITITFTELDALSFDGSARVQSASIRTPKLSIDVSGSATLDFDRIEVDRLAIDGSGRVRANIAGRAREQRIRISGAGDLQAPNLVSDTASVQVSGAGTVLINATRALAVDISGAGNVDYIGSPTLSKSVSGLGRVRQVDAPRTLPSQERRAPMLPGELPVRVA